MFLLQQNATVTKNNATDKPDYLDMRSENFILSLTEYYRQ